MLSEGMNEWTDNLRSAICDLKLPRKFQISEGNFTKGDGSRAGELAAVLESWMSRRGTSLQLLRPPFARAGPHFRSRDGVQRVRDLIFGTKTAPGARRTRSRSPFRPLAHLPHPVVDPATTLGACGTSFLEPRRLSARAGLRRGFRFDPWRTCRAPSGIPRRLSARAEPRRGFRFGVRRGVWAVASRGNGWFYVV